MKFGFHLQGQEVVKISYTVKDFAKDFEDAWYDKFDEKTRKKIDYELGGLQFGDVPTTLMELYSFFKKENEKHVLIDDLCNEFKRSEKLHDKFHISQKELMELFEENVEMGNFKKS